MPSLTQGNIRLDPGAALDETLAAVQNPTPGATYAYTLQAPDGSILQDRAATTRPFRYAPWLDSRLANNALPTTNGWTRATRRLRGTVPASGGFWQFLYTATAPGESYRAEFNISAPAAIADELLKMSFSPAQAARRKPTPYTGPLFRDEFRFDQDTGHDRVLLMSLPSYAPAGSGVSLGAGNSPQYLPIEGLIEFQPPSVRSETQPLQIQPDESADPEAAPTYSDSDGGDKSYPLQTAYQTRLIVGQAAARIAWNEQYASHGGPYGIRAAAFGKIPPPHWIYYDRGNLNFYVDVDAPSPDQIFPYFRHPNIICDWIAFISDFRQRDTPGGIFVDIAITPETTIQLRNAIPRYSDFFDEATGNRKSQAELDAAGVWQLAANISNAPSIDWTRGARTAG